MAFTLVPPGADPSADLGQQGGFTITPPLTPVVSNPTDEMSTVDRLLAGFGGGLTDLGIAGRKLGAKLGIGDLDAVNRDIAEKRRLDENLNNTTAGSVGRMAANVAVGLPAAMAAPGIIGATAVGAAMGALEPTTEDESIAWNAAKSALMGAGGQAVADAFGAILRGVKPTTEQITAAKEFADKWGGTLSRGQLTGSEILQRIERMAAGVGSKFSQNANEANRGAIKGAVDSITGGDAGAMYSQLAPYSMKVTPELVEAANRSAPFTTVDQGKMFSDLRDLLGARGIPGTEGLGPDALEQIQRQLGGAGKFPVGTNMPMTGDMGDFANAQGLRSLFAREANRAGQNTPAGAAFSNVADAFDNAMTSSLRDAGLPAETLRDMQRAYTVEKIVRPAALVDDAGAVTGYDPVKLSNIVQQIERSKPGLLDRLGDAGQKLRDAANFGKVTKTTSSSGTAENTIASKVAGFEIAKDALGALLHGGNVVGAMAQGLSPIFGALYAPRFVNAIMQGTRNGILPDMGRAASHAGDYVGALGTSAARTGITLRDLLGLSASQSGNQ